MHIYLFSSVLAAVCLSLIRAFIAWDEYAAEVVHMQKVSTNMTSCCRDAGLDPTCKVLVGGNYINVYHVGRYKSNFLGIISLTSFTNDFLVSIVFIWGFTSALVFCTFWSVVAANMWIKKHITAWKDGGLSHSDRVLAGVHDSSVARIVNKWQSNRASRQRTSRQEKQEEDEENDSGSDQESKEKPKKQESSQRKQQESNQSLFRSNRRLTRSQSRDTDAFQ